MIYFSGYLCIQHRVTEEKHVGKVGSGFEYFLQTFVLLSGLTFQLLGLDAEFCALSIADRFKGDCGPKIWVWAEKPYKIHDFHSNLCRHSLENLGCPSKLYRSMQNCMFYLLVTDLMAVVGQKLGVWAEKPYKIH